MKSLLKLAYSQSFDLARYLHSDLNLNFEINFSKNKISFYGNDETSLVAIKIPLAFNLKSKENIFEKNISVGKEIPPFMIMLIQAGNAALGFIKNGKIVQHKVIRKYMVRKKQGKAQISYLKRKGKSRAGSRIRLAESVEFFEEINQKMREWQNIDSPKSIIFNCTPYLWGWLFRSKPPPFFSKKDPLLLKLPIDVNIPNLKELERAADFAKHGYMNFHPNCPGDIKENMQTYLKLKIFTDDFLQLTE